jgi:hypothetical protein
MTELELTQFIGERAEMMAMLALTNVPGVAVRRQNNEDSGVDLLVSVSADRPSRVFGVQVRGATKVATYLAPNGFVKPELIENLKRNAADFPFPLCLFFFDMSDDSGYFGWLLAPGMAPGELVLRDEVAVARISDETINAAINEVDRWYDNRASLVTSRSA